MNTNQREIAMYGNLKKNIMESIHSSIAYRHSGIGMVITSYLSDVQEMNEHNTYGSYTESIRQTLNIVKMLVDEHRIGRIDMEKV